MRKVIIGGMGSGVGSIGLTCFGSVRTSCMALDGSIILLSRAWALLVYGNWKMGLATVRAGPSKIIEK